MQSLEDGELARAGTDRLAGARGGARAPRGSVRAQGLAPAPPSLPEDGSGGAGIAKVQ